MGIRKKKMTEYVRLSSKKWKEEEAVLRKGCVPVLVGKEEMSMERHHIHTNLLNHPYISALLELSALEFGFQQQGLLKIPCDAECFKRIIKMISKLK